MLNSSQMAKIRRAMRRSLVEAHQIASGGETEPCAVASHVEVRGPRQLRARAKAFLRRRRIRTHLVSGIEFEMAVFIAGPFTGAVLVTSIVAGVLLLAFELRLVYYFWRMTRRHATRLARITPAERLMRVRDQMLTPVTNADGTTGGI